MTRLPAPYGDCVKEGKTRDFIYRDKQYSTEGCQRSCIQKHLASNVAVEILDSLHITIRRIVL